MVDRVTGFGTFTRLPPLFIVAGETKLGICPTSSMLAVQTWKCSEYWHEGGHPARMTGKGRGAATADAIHGVKIETQIEMKRGRSTARIRRPAQSMLALAAQRWKCTECWHEGGLPASQ